MEKTIDYPIKYAVLELKEQGGWTHYYEDITQGFIASICYVVESKITYHADGTNEISHLVVFPYSDIESFKRALRQNSRINIERNIPHYDACDRPYPTHIVTELYDTYEEAKEEANTKNEEYMKEIIWKHPQTMGVISSINYKERYEELKKEFKQSLMICTLFEEYCLNNTQDMTVTKEETALKELNSKTLKLTKK